MVLSGLFMLQILRKREESFARMSFKSYDVRIALQLIMLGFLVLAISRVFDFMGLQQLNFVASVIGGSIATVLLTLAFLILNAVVFGPGNFLYYRLPSNYFGDEDRYA